MTNAESDVLVVGAGPTGLTLACALAQRGIRVRIVDAGNGPATGSRGKGLQPRTLELFDDLRTMIVCTNNHRRGPLRHSSVH